MNLLKSVVWNHIDDSAWDETDKHPDGTTDGIIWKIVQAPLMACIWDELINPVIDEAYDDK